MDLKHLSSERITEGGLNTLSTFSRDIQGTLQGQEKLIP